MHLPDEVVVRAAFSELRAGERLAVPRFLIARNAGQAGLPVLHYAFSIVLFLLVVSPFFTIVRKQAATEVPAVAVSFKAPTDFLLETPQADMLRSVPQFGERKVTQ